MSLFDEPDVPSKRKPKSKKTMQGRNPAQELQEEGKTHDRLHENANDSATSCVPEKETVDSPPSNIEILEDTPQKDTVDSSPYNSGILEEATTSLTDADKFAQFLKL